MDYQQLPPGHRNIVLLQLALLKEHSYLSRGNCRFHQPLQSHPKRFALLKILRSNNRWRRYIRAKLEIGRYRCLHFVTKLEHTPQLICFLLNFVCSCIYDSYYWRDNQVLFDLLRRLLRPAEIHRVTFNVQQHNPLHNRDLHLCLSGCVSWYRQYRRNHD